MARILAYTQVGLNISENDERLKNETDEELFGFMKSNEW